MELKEYLKIIRKYAKTYLTTIAAVVLGVGLYFFLQRASYETSLIINITRLGVAETSDYRYDDFYRLQADERFAETVVEWLKSPRIVSDIFSNAKINSQNSSLQKLAKTFSVEKRSSQIVAVKFESDSSQLGEKISASLVEIVSQKTQKLNEAQKEPNWFHLVAEKPLTIEKNAPYGKIFMAAFLFGIFAGFFVVMSRHYFE